MPAWPTLLPALALRGFSARPGDGLIRSKMDAGPAKVRRRTSASPAEYNLAHPSLTQPQMARLLDFYEDDVAGGALSFTMTDPLRGGTATFRFLEPPDVTSVGAAKWAVQIKLERLP